MSNLWETLRVHEFHNRVWSFAEVHDPGVNCEDVDILLQYVEYPFFLGGLGDGSISHFLNDVVLTLPFLFSPCSRLRLGKAGR